MNDFAADASGATAIEYALIASLISVVIVAAVGSVGSKVLGLFQSLIDKMN
ncbi:MAG: Flp family type IVb pilin [Pseudomonadota bacterium]